MCVGSNDYIESLSKGNDWYETTFIASFATLCVHRSHKMDIHFIHCQTPKAELTFEECLNLRPGTAEEIVSFLHGTGHYCYLEADLEVEAVQITDGKKYPLKP